MSDGKNKFFIDMDLQQQLGAKWTRLEVIVDNINRIQPTGLNSLEVHTRCYHFFLEMENCLKIQCP